MKHKHNCPNIINLKACSDEIYRIAKERYNDGYLAENAIVQLILAAEEMLEFKKSQERKTTKKKTAKKSRKAAA